MEKNWDVEDEVTEKRLRDIFQRFIDDLYFPSRIEIDDYYNEEEPEKKYVIRYKY